MRSVCVHHNLRKIHFDRRRSTPQIESDRAIAKIPGYSSGCSVSAQMDRALKKFLAYPIFDQPFRDAVCDVGL